MNQYLSDHTIVSGKPWKEWRATAVHPYFLESDEYLKLEPSQKQRL